MGGAGYSLELPCEFKFQGDKFSCNWLKERFKKRKSLSTVTKKKIIETLSSICTVLFRLRHCFYLGECVIKALKLSPFL